MNLIRVLLLTTIAAIFISQAEGRPAGISASPEDALPSMPQQAPRTVIGNVLDPSGAGIAGAKLVLTRSTGEHVSDGTTDANGTFRFEKLPLGNYHLVVHAEGFSDGTLDFSAGADAIPPLRIALNIAIQNEVVTVGADAAAPQVTTEISDNQSSNTIERAALDRVPVFDQDYITTLSRFLDDNATATSGVSLVVNGVESNGPGVTPSAIQEVKINQNPYSALFSRPGRARLEIITKGGTSGYHGTVNFLYRNSIFDARNTFAPVKGPEQRQFYEGSVTGPIGESKKTSFLVSLDEDVDDTLAIVNAQGVNGAIVQNVAAPIHHFFGSGRIFHDLANGDQFWIGYSYEHQSFMNQNVGGTTLAEAGYNTRFLEHEINVSYRHIVSTTWANQLRFLVGHNNSPVTSVTLAPQIIVSGAFTGGGAQANSRRTEYHFDGSDVVTYSSGKHTMNFGVDIPDISRRGADDFTNTLGTYTFGSLQNYCPGGIGQGSSCLQVGQPSDFILQRGQGHLVFLELNFAGFFEDNIRLTPNFALTLGARYYWQNYFHNDPKDFAPRMGFAYSPHKNSKTVIRGGAGLFFDRAGSRAVADLLHFNGANLFRLIPLNPVYPETPATLADVPTSVVTLDPRLHIPYIFQYSIGIERQVTAKSTFSATYVGTRGIDIFRSIDANAPQCPPPGVPCPSIVSRPDANLGQNREIQSDGYQKGNALELTFRGRPARFFSGQVQYTLSKTYNNTSGITYFPANSFDPAADWARSDNDRRHKFDLLGTFQFRKIFAIGTALSLYSGKPVNVTTGSDNNHDGISNDRPFGVPRNILNGPGQIGLDLNIAHDFVLSKSRKEAPTLTVSLNSFNALNHENDVTYIGVITSPNFGRAVAAYPPRRMQLNLQYKF